MSTEDSQYLKTSLHYTQKTLDRQVDGIDTVKTNIRAVLSAASLIVSLVSAMQFLTLKIDTNWIWLYHSGVIATAVLYVALIVVCIMGLWPTYVVGPVKTDWDELTTAFKGLSERDALAKELSAVLNSIELNSPIVKRYRNLQMIALALLPLIVILMLLMALIPRV